MAIPAIASAGPSQSGARSPYVSMTPPPTDVVMTMPKVMNDVCTELTSAPAFARRCTRTAIAGFIVTPTRPMPSMHTTAAALSSAKSAKPSRKWELRPRPTSSTVSVCRSASRPTTMLPTTVAAPYATSSSGTAPAPNPVISVRIGLR